MTELKKETTVLQTHENNNSVSWRYGSVQVTILFLLLFIAGGLGYWLRDTQVFEEKTTASGLLPDIDSWFRFSQVPEENSADVGFARDMSEHHRQAVEMSTLIYDRTEDEEIRILAYDILITQQAQIGIMSGWLDVWGYRWSDTGPKMEWMGMSVDGLMPGMATRDELNQLQAAQGVEADALFLQLMIPHHRAGVDMAKAAARQAATTAVRNLAQGMAEAQQAEIEYMQGLLQGKGYEPVPDMPSMDMDEH